MIWMNRTLETGWQCRISQKRDDQVLLLNSLKTTIQSNPKTDILILPLCLENNAATTGTAAIIEQFGKEFGVPCEHDKEYRP